MNELCLREIERKVFSVEISRITKTSESDVLKIGIQRCAIEITVTISVGICMVVSGPRMETVESAIGVKKVDYIGCIG